MACDDIVVPENVKDETNKRANYLTWDEHFMAMALLTSMRSKDPSTQVGACIVNDKNRIIGLGYNGMPNGCSDDIFPWTKDDNDKLKNKSTFVCHAELNAILNSISRDFTNCIIYVTLFPCNECAKAIIQADISKVIYLSIKNETKAKVVAAKMMFDAAGIEYRQFVPTRSPIVLNFEQFSDINEIKPEEHPQSSKT